jgi:hypothetical protein
MSSTKYLMLNASRKRRYHVLLIEALESITFIPTFMLNGFVMSTSELEKLNEEAVRYFHLIAEFNKRNEEIILSLLMQDLKINQLQHHSFHCISFTAAFPSIIGLTLQEFGCLFDALRVDMADLFTRCPETIKEGGLSLYCSRRMKLFMTLFRCRQGCSFRHMEVCFGWAHNTIQEDYFVIMRRMQLQMICYHRDFLKCKGRLWQLQEIYNWRLRHKDEIHIFEDRVNYQNDYSRRHGTSEMIPWNLLAEMEGGSIGAFDCTYSVRPYLSQSTLHQNNEQVSKDPMYSEYKKVTAYKIGLLVSHGFDDPKKKHIIYMNYGKARASDTGLYDVAAKDLYNVFMPNAVIEGDHAFHGCWRMICPYTSTQLSVGDRHDLEHFNHTLSRDRIVSEHGVRFSKEWGLLRGRTDFCLFRSNANFELAMEVCWALHNYKCDGCPSKFASMT